MIINTKNKTIEIEGNTTVADFLKEIKDIKLNINDFIIKANSETHWYPHYPVYPVYPSSTPWYHYHIYGNGTGTIDPHYQTY